MKNLTERSQKVQAPQILNTYGSRGANGSRKGVLTAKADVRTFHKLALF
jgi:hypothetical protein